VSKMNPLIVQSWVNKNRNTIRQLGQRSLKFTPAIPIDFEFVAHQVALAVGKGTADMELFEREFWDCYRAKLNNLIYQGDLFLAEEDGEITAFVRDL
jgi:hypothetical protein